MALITAKEKIEQLQAAVRRAERDATLWERYAEDLNGANKYHAVEQFTDDQGGKYTIWLYRPCSPSGGYAVTRFRYSGQFDSFRIAPFDELVDGLEQLPHGAAYLKLRIAVERLAGARDAAIRGNVEAAREQFYRDFVTA